MMISLSSTVESLPEGTMGPVVTVGIITFLLLAGGLFLLTRAMRKGQERAVEAYRPLAEPLYTGASGKTTVARGWYPLAEGDRDRYHDGASWTDHYRPHTEDSRVDDPAPEEGEE